MSHADEDRLVAAAGERGEQAGLSAASWVFDGNTTDAHYRRVLRMLDDGDPALYDLIAEPDWLSGEWAGESITELLGDLIEEGEELGLEDIGDLLMQKYEEEAHDEFWFTVESDARNALEGIDDDEDGDDDDEEDGG